jgi:putative radical SAM enzyme (TIGR03279 family)
VHKVITDVEKGSAAQHAGIKKGWRILSVNGHKINDVLDYNFYTSDKKLIMTFADENKKIHIVKIHKKDPYAPMGLTFETYLMDEAKSCHNKCIFCFIDQMPKGMRDTLYFKDDDHRLSFLTGNYVTLTNTKDDEIDRIIKQRISPVNISVHTINPELRIKMLNNKNAGKIGNIMHKLAKGHVQMNGQIVLCPHINDGEELDKTLAFFKTLHPWLLSVSVVPVGLTKFRSGLYPIEPFNKESAQKVIEQIEKFGNDCRKELGTRLVYPSDEFYIKAEKPMPDTEFYEDFSQLENGVGITSLLINDFRLGLSELDENKNEIKASIAAGVDIAPILQMLINEAKEKLPNLDIKIYPIINAFFGESITVTGLITGRDLINGLKEQDLGDKLILSSSMLRDGEDVFLDGLTTKQLSDILGVPIFVTEPTGEGLLKSIVKF